MTIKNFFLFALILTLLAPTNGFAQKMGIAAVVNDDVITHSDVEGRVQLGMRASNIKDTPETRKKFEKQALSTLIEEQLRLQEASRLNVEITDEEIETAIDNIAGQNKVEPAKFKELLSRSYGTLPSLKRQIKAQLSWTQVARKRLRPQVNVTEADIDNFISDLNKHEGKSEYNIAEILLFTNDDTKADEKLALANDLIKQLRQGASFSGIARQFSQGKEARNGGVVGWVLEGAIDPKIDTALATMSPNAISDPIKTDMGYHIILLRSKRTVSTKAADIVMLNLKQALIPLSETATNDEISQAQAKANSLQSQTTSCEAMDQLIATQNNIMSKDLGMIPINQLPAAVAHVINGLEDATLSTPIRAAEGFLVMMVCGREKSSTSEQLRDQIANKIGADRLERLQQRYVRDLRATAYIDIKN